METSVRIKTAKDWMKYNKDKVAMILYCVAALFMVLISVFVYSQPVVPICCILLLETGIVALLNNCKLWIHGIFIVVQLIAGILMDKTAIVVLLTICYLVGVFSLIMVGKDTTRNNKR